MPFDALLAAAHVRLAASSPPEVVSDAASVQGRERALSKAEGCEATGSAVDGPILGANLLKAYSYSGSLVELHSYVPRMVREVSERPVASLLARFQGVGLPQPPGWWLLAGDHSEIGMLLLQFRQDLRRSIRRTIINNDDFKGRVVLAAKGGHRLPYALFLVPGRHHDRDKRRIRQRLEFELRQVVDQNEIDDELDEAKCPQNGTHPEDDF